MPRLTVATFNAENLFARFRFKKYPTLTPTLAQKISKDGWLINDTVFEVDPPKVRKITAGVIKETKADVVALQEVECLDTLRRFNTKFLKTAYPYQLVVDSRDPRLIDVAVLSKYPFANIRTHQFDKDGNTLIFSRDDLEVDLAVGGVTLTLFVNHLKSMMEGRDKTAARRLLQARRVVDILKARYGDPPNGRFIVLGDMNDYMDPAAPSPALQHLLGAGLVNVVDRIPSPADRWTHYWAKQKQYRQLDYLLLSPQLAQANAAAVPVIVRSGLPPRAKLYTGKRLAGVTDKAKASDHCPVAITLDV